MCQSHECAAHKAHFNVGHGAVVRKQPRQLCSLILTSGTATQPDEQPTAWLHHQRWALCVAKAIGAAATAVAATTGPSAGAQLRLLSIWSTAGAAV